MREENKDLLIALLESILDIKIKKLEYKLYWCYNKKIFISRFLSMKKT